MDSSHNLKNQINAIPCALLTVKGKTQPIDVYEVMGLK
jgi:hypothetical protein